MLSEFTSLLPLLIYEMIQTSRRFWLELSIIFVFTV